MATAGPREESLNTGRRRSAEYTQPKETKTFSKTSEFFVWLGTVAAILIADWQLESFNDDTAWTLVAVVSVGYMLSRGLAKSGGRKSDFEGYTVSGDGA
jgi:hypothetical protein